MILSNFFGLLRKLQLYKNFFFSCQCVKIDKNFKMLLFFIDRNSNLDLFLRTAMTRKRYVFKLTWLVFFIWYFKDIFVKSYLLNFSNNDDFYFLSSISMSVEIFTSLHIWFFWTSLFDAAPVLLNIFKCWRKHLRYYLWYSWDQIIFVQACGSSGKKGCEQSKQRSRQIYPTVSGLVSVTVSRKVLNFQ